MKVTLYRTTAGNLSFYEFGATGEVLAELEAGYRIEEGAYDGLFRIFGPPGQLGMSIDRAIEAGVLRVLETK